MDAATDIECTTYHTETFLRLCFHGQQAGFHVVVSREGWFKRHMNLTVPTALYMVCECHSLTRCIVSSPSVVTQNHEQDKPSCQ